MNRSIAYWLGFFVGILVVALVSVIFTIIMKKKNGKCEYDERQELARGKAYKYAYFTLLMYLLLSIIGMNLIEAHIPFTIVAFVGICISVSVYAISCIKNDAYIGLQRNANKTAIAFILAGIINLGCGCVRMVKGEQLLAEDFVDNVCINFMAGLLLFLIAIVLLVKAQYDKKHEDEE